MSTPLISLHGLSRAYTMGDTVVHALRDVSLDIMPGEFVAIIGPSGSGKTTLMYVLGLLDQPTGGSYRLDGREVAHLDDASLSQLRNQSIGYVFQQYNLLPDLSVTENIALGLAYAGVDAPARAARAEALATTVGLGHRFTHTARELSGGQMQRVAIARGLAGRPRLILADEPTGNLDSKTGVEIMALLSALHADGHTIIIVTHDPGVAAQADRAIRIVDGEIVEDSRRTTAPEVPSTTSDAPSSAPSPAVAGMSLADTFSTAIREGLLANRLRSALTMLGIVFGIAAVIAMTAITEGGKRQQLDQIRQIGMNNVQVRALDLDGARLLRQRRINPDGLTREDLAAVSANVPGIVAATAWKNLKAEIRRGEYLVDDAATVGVTGDFPAVANVQVARGRFIDARDEATFARVCVLGAAVARGLGLADDAIGAVIIVGDEPCTVVGITVERPYTVSDVADVAVQDRNRDVYLPLASLDAYFRHAKYDSRVDALSLRLDSDELLLERSRLVKRIVSDRHRGAEDLAVAVPLESLKQAQRTKEVFNVIIVVIAAISLIVGGIGIMNIMLANVTARTREIGIRRAVGASRRDIMRQFLAEAALIAACGGVLGLLLGLGGGLLVQAVFGFPVAFNAAIMLIAVGSSTAIGIGFGLYPAWLAARMNPVEALRA